MSERLNEEYILRSSSLNDDHEDEFSDSIPYNLRQKRRDEDYEKLYQPIKGFAFRERSILGFEYGIQAKWRIGFGMMSAIFIICLLGFFGFRRQPYIQYFKSMKRILKRRDEILNIDKDPNETASKRDIINKSNEIILNHNDQNKILNNDQKELIERMNHLLYPELWSLGNKYFDLKKYHLAKIYLIKSLELCEEEKGKENEHVQYILWILYQVYTRLYDKISQKACLLRLIEYFRNKESKLNKRQKRIYAISLNYMSEIYIYERAYERSYKLLIHSQSLFKSIDVHLQKDFDYACILKNLGIINQRLGDCKQSDFLFREAYQIFKKSNHQSNDLFATQTLIRLFLLRHDLGLFNNGIKLIRNHIQYYESKDLKKKDLFEKKYKQYITTSNRDDKNHLKFRKYHSPYLSIYAIIYRTLGMIYCVESKYQEARDYFYKVLKLIKDREEYNDRYEMNHQFRVKNDFLIKLQRIGILCHLNQCYIEWNRRLESQKLEDEIINLMNHLIFDHNQIYSHFDLEDKLNYLIYNRNMIRVHSEYLITDRVEFIYDRRNDIINDIINELKLNRRKLKEDILKVIRIKIKSLKYSLLLREYLMYETLNILKNQEKIKIKEIDQFPKRLIKLNIGNFLLLKCYFDHNDRNHITSIYEIEVDQDILDRHYIYFNIRKGLNKVLYGLSYKLIILIYKDSSRNELLSEHDQFIQCY